MDEYLLDAANAAMEISLLSWS
jgi:hypothetical protein